MSLKELESKIRKFLSGQDSAQGKELFDQWYDSFNNKKVSLSHDQKKQVKKRIYQNIRTQIDHTNKEAPPLKRIYAFTKVAAAVALVVFTYWGVQQWSYQKVMTYQTAFGETEQLLLPDGTTVSLNANSSLRYVNKNPREVWLDGEAFFEVKKQPRTKAVFLVHTQDLVIEVLGTAFNVNSRHEKTKVVLEEGSIKLNLDGGKEEMMEPGDLISYSGKEAKILERQKAVPTEVHSSWKDGSIIFSQIPLKEAMQKVADHYGIHFEFGADSLKKKEVEGAVPMDDLRISLLVMEKSFNIQIDKQDEYFLITQKNEVQ